MKKPTPLLGLLLLAAVSRSIAGQAADTAAAETPRIGPPIRQISTASAVSTERIGSILGVRELPDGRVLVNDGASRRLLLLDTMLVLERVVLDSLSERENTYGTEQGILVAHRGDSTLFIDPESLAMLVIDPDGNVVRVRSVPRAQDLFRFRTTVYGNPATDAHGRLVYRMYARPAPPARPPPRGVPWIPQEPDSAFIVGLDLDARRLDTLGVIRIPTSEYRIRARPGGGFSFSQARNPMPISDLWAVLPGGGVAFVRAIDYRVDYLNADGSWTSSGKIPYDWQPVSEEEKRRLVDSVHAVQMREARNAYTTSVIRYVNTYRRDYPPNFTAPEGYAPPNGFLKSWTFPPGVNFPERYIHGCATGEEPTVTPAAGEEGGEAPVAAAAPMAERMAMVAGMPGPPPRGRPSCIPQPIPNLARIPDPPRMREVSVISPNALPDFRPPFATGALRADLDGNLWVQTNPARPTRGGPVYDIVSRAGGGGGQLVDRIQVPIGYTLVGFGRDRVAYVATRDAQGVHLARVRLQ